MIAGKKAAVGMATAGIVLLGTAGPAAAESVAQPAPQAQQTQQSRQAQQGQQSRHSETKPKARDDVSIVFKQHNTKGVKGALKKISSKKGCVRVVTVWYKKGKIKDTDTSKYVCKKGSKKNFSFKPGDKHRFKATKVNTYAQAK
ncbi:hypothetical protein [Streptomyces sp. ODS28]|uniref:hypothetical protein n=1 Tax=Streptomyces sp. ODS28 TaxID=3136688 RepID=UPI0031EE2D86